MADANAVDPTPSKSQEKNFFKKYANLLDFFRGGGKIEVRNFIKQKTRFCENCRKNILIFRQYVIKFLKVEHNKDQR